MFPLCGIVFLQVLKVRVVLALATKHLFHVSPECFCQAYNDFAIDALACQKNVAQARVVLALVTKHLFPLLATSFC